MRLALSPPSWQEYLRSTQMPIETSLCRVLEGGENEAFEEQFGFTQADPARCAGKVWGVNVDRAAFVSDGSKFGESKAQDVARKLYDALNKRMFANKQLLIDTLAPMDWVAVGAIAVAFEAIHPTGWGCGLALRTFILTCCPHSMTLREALTLKVHFKLRATLLALVTPPDVLRAELVADALKRRSPDVNALCDCLAFLSPAGLEAVNDALKAQEGRGFAELVGAHVKDKLLADALLALGSSAARSAGADPVADAQAIYAAGEKKIIGTDKAVFVAKIMGASSAYVGQIAQAYPSVTKKGTTLEDSIKVQCACFYQCVRRSHRLPPARVLHARRARPQTSAARACAS